MNKRLFRVGLWLNLIFIGLRPGTGYAAYSYGITPSGASAADAGLAAKYADYKTRYFVDCSGTQTRVANNQGSTETFSEGQAYGMLMVAYLEPDATGPALMDKLLAFLNGKLDANGLMHWRVTCSGVTGSNAASDAEVDYALALIKAHQRWPGRGYNTAAINFISRIRQYEADACGLKPGDVWGGCSSEANPSYASLGYFPCFGSFEGQASAWNTIRSNTYNRQLAYWYTNYALPPDWVLVDGGATSGRFSRGNYYYDAARTPWRLALDYLWYGNTDSQNQCNRMVNNFKTTDPNPATMGDGYNYNSGTKYSNNHNAVFVGPAGVGAMVSSAHQTWLNNAYNDIKNLAQQNYFLDSWRLLSLMVLTGVMDNPCGAGGPASTPTRTFTQGPTFTRTPTATPTSTPAPAFQMVKSANPGTVAIGQTFTYLLGYRNLSSGPDTVGVTPGVELRHHNANMGSSANRMSLNFQIYNNSGAAINLVNYRIRYWAYGIAPMDSAASYSVWTYYDQAATGSGTSLTYPLWDGGAKKANMELRIAFSGGSLANGSTNNWEGAWGSDSNSSTTSDDASYPGAVAAYSAANAANIVLEQNVAGTWKPVTGSYPGGAAALSGVVVWDTLPSKVSFVSSVPAPASVAGSYYTWNIGTLSPAQGGAVTITAYVNGTALAGDVVANNACVGAPGQSNVCSGVNVNISAAASPTRSPTRSATPSSTRSSTPTSTATPMAPSATASSTRSATPTFSPTRSSTPSATSSFTAGSTVTFSASPSSSATRSTTSSPTTGSTSTRSATPTFSPTRSSTPSATSSFTAGSTVTFSASPSLSATRSTTPSATASSTAGSTATRSATPTISPSRSTTPSATSSSTAGSTATRSATPTFSPSRSSTPSATSSFTAVSTATRSATPTFSPTRSFTPSATSSFTAVSTATFSHTASATRSVTPSRTSTPTRTPTVTPSASPSFTASPTPSQTATDVPVGSSPTDTPSISPTYSTSPSQTASPSATLSETELPTETSSATETATEISSSTETMSPSPSATATPTLAASSTATPLASPSSSPSQVSSPSSSPTLGATFTATASASSTRTVLPSLTRTLTPSASATLQFSATWLPSGSPTALPLNSSTSTLTPTRSATQISSPSPTPTRSSTSNPSVTATTSPSGSQISGLNVTQGPLSGGTTVIVNGAGFTGAYSVTLGGQAVSSFTVLSDSQISLSTPASATAGWVDLTLSSGSGSDTLSAAYEYKADPTPEPDDGFEIEEAMAVPNPNPMAMLAKLKGRADDIRVKVYSEARNAINEWGSGPRAKGWANVPLDAAWLASARSGTYHYKIWALRDGKVSKPVIGSWVILK